MDELPALTAIGKLRMVPVLSTRQLLEISREQWFGEHGKCFVAGCAGIRGPVDRHLRRRWGVELGALGAIEAPARGPPSRAPPRAGRADPMATLGALAEIAFSDPLPPLER